MKEASFQSTVIKWLRKHGCFVMKVQAGPGVPAGTADVFFCKEGFYGWLECKASKTAKKQPHQPEFIKKMDEWSYARFVWPENWAKVQKELGGMLE